MRKKVLIVVLGWWSALDKHVQKYATMYQKNGYKTFVYNPSGTLVFRPISFSFAIGHLLDEILMTAEKNECDSLLFHSFSNNGCFIFHALRKKLQRRSYPIKVVGAIFDSCPGLINMKTFYKAIFAAKISSAFKLFSISPVIYLIWLILATRKRILFKLVALVSPFFVNHILQQRYAKKHLNSHLYYKSLNAHYEDMYIYSTGDHIINPKAIESAVEKIRSAHGNSLLCHFEGSDHCAHFTKHPIAYEEAVINFADKLAL